MRKNPVLQIVSGVLSFLMMICISLLVSSISLEATIFNTNFIIKRMDNKYYDSVISSLTRTLKDELAPPSGMPEEVFEGLFNRYLIKEDAQASVRAVFANIDYTYDSSRIHNILMTRFTKYVQENNIEISGTNIDTLTDYCLKEYERQISIPYMKTFAPLRQLFENAFPYALLGISLLLILLTLFLFRIHRFIHRALRYSIYSLFASALMVVPFPLFFLIQGSYKKVNIMPEHVKMLFVSLFQAALFTMLISGLIIGILGFALLPQVKNLRIKAIKGECGADFVPLFHRKNG